MIFWGLGFVQNVYKNIMIQDKICFLSSTKLFSSGSTMEVDDSVEFLYCIPAARWIHIADEEAVLEKFHLPYTLLFRITEEVVGSGKTCIAWRPNGNLLAMASASKKVILYDRKALQSMSWMSPGEYPEVYLYSIWYVLNSYLIRNIIGMAWDKEGDVLGILTDASSLAILWNINAHNTEQLETAMGSREHALCLAWSSVSSLLAVGNSNGNLFIYNRKLSRKIPVLGKHQQKITDVAITKHDDILCCSDDNTISNGVTLRSLTVSAEPSSLKIGEVKRPGGNVDTIVCAYCDIMFNISFIDEKYVEQLPHIASSFDI
ncbi:WD domain, G-beta repeat protein [Dictyocaulus viviparus]|uniref:WD domain, G-beta repeat protein n=1 Tax=Dictyocaulus viviparus TaxID=29172 RepID=A0A0D8XBI4_DICVI|nr:WD domain, G-beta repeat protein [Dictyocaulus viviparus]